MKLTGKNKIEPGMVLTVLFVLLVAAEIYLAYFSLLQNLTVSEEGPDTKNIVRVDSKAYRGTLDYLTGLTSYTPPAETYRNLFIKQQVPPPVVPPPTTPAANPTNR